MNGGRRQRILPAGKHGKHLRAAMLMPELSVVFADAHSQLLRRAGVDLTIDTSTQSCSSSTKVEASSVIALHGPLTSDGQVGGPVYRFFCFFFE